MSTRNTPRTDAYVDRLIREGIAADSLEGFAGDLEIENQDLRDELRRTIEQHNKQTEKLCQQIVGLKLKLQIIADYGGSKTDDGLSCNGSWCAEQARASLSPFTDADDHDRAYIEWEDSCQENPH